MENNNNLTLTKASLMEMLNAQHHDRAQTLKTLSGQLFNARKADLLKLEKFIAICGMLADNVQISNIKPTPSGYANNGDVAECIVKYLLQGKNKLQVAHANGYDAVINGKQVEIKSEIINRSTPLQKAKPVYMLTLGGLYYIENTTALQGQRLTAKLANELGTLVKAF